MVFYDSFGLLYQVYLDICQKNYISSFIFIEATSDVGHSKTVSKWTKLGHKAPKEFRFENAKEVFVEKFNGAVILFPKSNHAVWNTFFDSLEDFSDDFMDTRTEPAQEREEFF
jgi:antitoxin VapB